MQSEPTHLLVNMVGVARRDAGGVVSTKDKSCKAGTDGRSDDVEDDVADAGEPSSRRQVLGGFGTDAHRYRDAHSQWHGPWW